MAFDTALQPCAVPWYGHNESSLAGPVACPATTSLPARTERLSRVVLDCVPCPPRRQFLAEEDAMAVTLRPVTRENWRAVARLEVAEGQRQFVAPNVYSLAEAAYE